MKEKWQSIRGFFRKNSRKLIPLLLLAAILLPIVVDNSYVLGICTKILLYMLLASSVNVINGYSGQLLSVMPAFCAWARTRQPS